MRVSWSTVLRTLPHSESTPPIYYLAALAWTKLFGLTEFGLRSLSALAGTLTVPLAYGAGAAFASRRAGLIAAALVAVNPFLVWYSQEARAYALAALFTAAALMFFARACSGERASNRDLALWALSSALAVATHYFAIFVIAPMGAWMVWRTHPRRAVLIANGAVVAAILALVPLLISQESNGRATWIATISLPLRLAQVGEQYMIGFDSPLRIAALLASLALVALAAIALLRYGDRRARLGAALAGALGALGILVPLLFTAAGDDFLISRNTIGSLVPLIVAVACGLAALRKPWLAAAASAALCAIGAFVVVAVARDRTLQRPDYRGLATAIGIPTHDRLVLVPGGYRSQPLKLYLRNSSYLTNRYATVTEIDVVAARSPVHQACWWGAACNLPRLPVFTQFPLPGFTLTGQTTSGLFTVERFQARTPQTFGPNELQNAVPTLPRFPRVLVYLQLPPSAP